MENFPTEIAATPTATMSDGDASHPRLRQYDLLLDTTAQMVARRRLQERLLLAVETITTGLGDSQAAVALAAERQAALRVRAAAGFPDENAIERVTIPLDSSAPCITAFHEGRPASISLHEDKSSAAFFDLKVWRQHLLVFPLFGREAVEKGDWSLTRRPRFGEDYWASEASSSVLGLLFVGVEREERDAAALNFLMRFADLMGVVAAGAIRSERLRSTVSKLQRERQWVESIMKSVADPIVLTNLDNEILLQNQRAEELFSDRKDANEGKRRALEMNDLLFSAYLSSAAVASEEIVGRDLTLVDPIEGSDIHFEVISTLASGVERGRQAEIELIDPQVGDSLPMEITSAEVLDATGQVTAVVSVLHDLSEIRELERRRVEQQLFESEKLAAVGRLAASIAHEVNNPLEAIKNSLYLLSTGKKLEQNARFLDVARRETERVSHIIRQMLGFARRSGDVEWADVNQLLEEMLILVEKKMKQARVDVVREFDPRLPQVRARADQLRQVFLNLLLNAQQAMENGGRLRLSSSLYEHALQPTVSVRISDTGRGIPEADIARIFEPFFSTRMKGTGLGLWVTQDIVRHHGGRIEVTSDEGLGTTFNVILPVDSPTLSETDAGQKA